jgi:hypothetical protein|tara:strand:+ start:58 stop:291 length:234 start_codon:yes stop_codon:yes gene_type:complete
MGKVLWIIVALVVIVGLVIYFSGSDVSFGPRKDKGKSLDREIGKTKEVVEPEKPVVPKGFKNADTVSNIEELFGGGR